jgi:hypothetical protein
MVCFDMGANAWEWTTDARGNERRTVGSSWWYGAFNMKADVQAYKPADFYAVYIGFRCVYDLTPGVQSFVQGQAMMTSLPEGYRALVVGATGAIGGALLQQLQADTRCAAVGGCVTPKHARAGFAE